jgi:hypothetical protein
LKKKGSSAPSEFLATVSLRVREKIIHRNKEIALKNFGIFNEFVKKYSQYIEWVPPRAGVVGFPRFKIETNGLKIAEQIALDLITSKGVLILPG